MTVMTRNRDRCYISLNVMCDLSDSIIKAWPDFHANMFLKRLSF